jgi:hypothetical protein
MNRNEKVARRQCRVVTPAAPELLAAEELAASLAGFEGSDPALTQRHRPAGARPRQTDVHDAPLFERSFDDVVLREDGLSRRYRFVLQPYVLR